MDEQYETKVKELENDWPLECEECSTRVNEKIKQANHDALARMASQKDAQLKARGVRVWSRRWDTVYWIGGLAWLATLGIFSLWHLAHLIAYPEQYVTIHKASLQSCTTQAWKESRVDATCAASVDRWIEAASLHKFRNSVVESVHEESSGRLLQEDTESGYLVQTVDSASIASSRLGAVAQRPYRYKFLRTTGLKQRTRYYSSSRSSPRLCSSSRQTFPTPRACLPTHPKSRPLSPIGQLLQCHRRIVC